MLQPPPLAAVVALASAAFLGFVPIFIKRGLAYSSVSSSVFVVLLVDTAMLTPLALVSYRHEPSLFTALPYFILGGGFAVAMARSLYYAGIERVGAAVAASLIKTNSLFIILPAVLLLGESLTAQALTGILLVVSGAFLLERSTVSGHGVKLKAPFSKNILLPLLAAAASAIGFAFKKGGLNIYNSPTFGSAVGAASSLLTITLAYLLFGKLRLLVPSSRKSLPSFIIAGFFHGLSWLLQFYALSLGSLLIVVPILASSALFTMLFTPLLLRRVERLGVLTVVGGVGVVLGVMVLSLARA